MKVTTGGIVFVLWLLLSLGLNPFVWLQAINWLIGIVILYFLISFILAQPVYIRNWYMRKYGYERRLMREYAQRHN